jgi:hypothetical protein
MINMKALPPSWAALLSRVKIRLDCSAVIAGGAIRDLLLAEEPVKDLGIFVLDPSVRDLGETHFGVWRGCSRRTIQRQSRASERP